MRSVDSIPIRHARADLAALVRRASAGERTVISVGGQPAAQLVPVNEPTPGPPTLDDLIARGWIIPPRRTGPLTRPEPVPVFAGARLDRLLREVRG